MGSSAARRRADTEVLGSPSPAWRFVTEEEVLQVYGWIPGIILTHFKRTSPQNLDDMCQDGAVGLMKAAVTYDPARGASFATYARIRILGEVRDAFRAQDHLSKNARRVTRRLRGAETELRQLLGGEPTLEDCADYMGISPAEVDEIRCFDQLHSVHDVEVTPRNVLDDYVEDESETGVSPAIATKIKNAIRGLSSRRRAVIKGYFYQGKNLEELGAEYAVTSARMCQIKQRALLRMQKFMLGEFDTPRIAEISPRKKCVRTDAQRERRNRADREKRVRRKNGSQEARDKFNARRRELRKKGT